MNARAAIVIAAVYGYFLIFAQFSFVELLRAGGASLMQEKISLGIMAIAGVVSGFIAAWRGASPGMVRAALGVASVTAALAPFANTVPLAFGIALATGCALGVATVALAAMLPAWCGVAWIGLGTGIGYACCNLPAVFTQSPSRQAWIASGFALVGLFAVPSVKEWRKHESKMIFPLWGALAIFTALVWMDSAAFFIIQHSDDLKSGTWGDGLLWRNAAVHLAGAIVAGIWLAKGGARVLPAFAWTILAVAALAVNSESTRGLAGWFYPVGVSLYSAALVAWPGWFSGADGIHKAGWRAAWLFAIAGWFGSADGIGMAQTLERVPPEFVAGAGCVVVAVMALSDLKQWRSVVAVAVVVLVAMGFPKNKTTRVGDAVARGKQVYLSEGCIHCHSQYVRPGSVDGQNWGPVIDLREVLAGQPVLIGNRRQGPDLSNVGARRSDAWLKLHFIDPQAFAPGSNMPTYGHLFETGRGEDLVNYLRKSRVSGMPQILKTSFQWTPRNMAPGEDGKTLYSKLCLTCHGSNGTGNGPIAPELERRPANLVAGPFVWSPPGKGLEQQISRVIKFGLIGTDMPGHEVLTDAQLLALRDYVLELRVGN